MELNQSLTVAAKDEVFDTLLRDSAQIVRLAKGSAAEAEYRATDVAINRQITELGRGLFPREFADRHIFVSDSWWPNHTRYVDASIDGFTQMYYDGLRAVLSAAPSGWRIQVVLYGDIANGKTMIGSAVIWANRILLDRAFYGLLTWRRLDFRCDSEPVWLETATGKG